MAKLRGNVPSGKLGNIVYCTRDGRTYLRSVPKRVRQPKTEAQKAHWSAFGTLAKLSSDLSEAHAMGFAKAAKTQRKNSHSIFRHVNKAAVTGEGVDYASLVLSEGRVPTVDILSMQLDNKGVLTLAYGNDPKPERCGNNAVVIVAYCPDRHENLIDDHACRRDGKLTMALPKKWKGYEVHLYLFMRDAYGNTSASIYLNQPQEASL